MGGKLALPIEYSVAMHNGWALDHLRLI